MNRKILVSLAALILIGGWWIFKSQNPSAQLPQPQNNIPEKELTFVPKNDNENAPLTLVESRVILPKGSTLSINDFPDQIKVSAGDDPGFGSSDRIKGSMLSPDKKWLAIAISGAAHDFGWIYDVATKKLTPVIFSYGGGVEVKEWKDNRTVVFLKTSPKPETREVLINVGNLPEYPL